MKYTANDKPAIRPERIERVRKLLQDLPEKDTRISKRETVTRLEADIRKALKKGYTPKEIVALMKAGGIIVSMQLIKEVLEPENKKEILKEEVTKTNIDDTLETEPEVETENNTENALETSLEISDTLATETKESVLENAESNNAKTVSETLEKTVEAENKTTEEYKGQFEIIPDRPDDEL